MSEVHFKAIAFLSVCGGFGFGVWQHNPGAGMWMAVILFCMLGESHDWRHRS